MKSRFALLIFTGLSLLVVLSACNFTPPSIPSVPDIKIPTTPSGITLPTSGSTSPTIPAEVDFPFIPAGGAADFLDRPLLLTGWTLNQQYYTALPNVAVAWGPSLPTAKADQAFFIDYTRMLQRQEIHFIGAGITPMHQVGDHAPSLPEFACLDLDGNPIHVEKPGMGGRYGDQYWMNLMNPGWQNLLIQSGKDMIDLGVEGLSIDESTFNRQVIYSAGGTFDEYSMQGFRDYLADKYSAAELKARFEIADISSFNFRDYIIAKGLRETWNQNQSAPLPITWEFDEFQLLASMDFWGRLSAELKDYARTEYGREFMISMNGSPQFSMHILPQDFQDYLTGEQFYFHNSSVLPKAAVVLKLAEGLNSRTALLVEVAHDFGELPLTTRDMFKYIFADIYAANGLMVTDGDYFKTMRGWNYEDNAKVHFNIDEADRYVTLAADHPELYGLAEPAEIAVIHSIASRREGMPVEDPDSGEGEIKGVIEMLLNLNLPHRMIVAGDGTLITQTFTLEYLQAYPVVLLPGFSLMTDTEAETLLAYVRGGGHIISLGAFGTHDNQGRVVLRPDLVPLRGAGEHSLGQGTWYSIGSPLGTDYYWNSAAERAYQPEERAFNDATLVQFKDAILSYADPSIETNAPIMVNIRRYIDGDRTVLHLVNYDYDQVADSFNPAAGLDVSVCLPDGAAPVTAMLYDFDQGTSREIEFQLADGWASFNLPSLYAYAIVEFK